MNLYYYKCLPHELVGVYSFADCKIDDISVVTGYLNQMINFENTPEKLEIKYREALLESIKNFWSSSTQKKLKIQREKINATYSWDVRSFEWKKFFDNARKLKAKS